MNSVFKALADPSRRRVLELLRVRPMSAGELSDQFPLSKPTMSAHFTVLREANLIDMHKSGKVVTYQLNLSVLEEALLGFAGLFRMRGEPDPSPLSDPDGPPGRPQPVLRRKP